METIGTENYSRTQKAAWWPGNIEKGYEYQIDRLKSPYKKMLFNEVWTFVSGNVKSRIDSQVDWTDKSNWNKKFNLKNRRAINFTFRKHLYSYWNICTFVIIFLDTLDVIRLSLTISRLMSWKHSKNVNNLELKH